LVVGAGVGGVAAALGALRRGASVVLTSDDEWIGGQLTSQMVPPDEHPWVEEYGVTASYRRYRDAVREHYRSNYPLTPSA
ncbi:FAD-dependent oxidoreductase, partial [Staphylococcus aureus]|nr:FAD-dependent oxidoreductase [Staphylococcus aureus]